MSHRRLRKASKEPLPPLATQGTTWSWWVNCEPPAQISRQNYRQVDGKDSQEEVLQLGSESISEHSVFNATETAQECGLGDKGQGWHSESIVCRAGKRQGIDNRPRGSIWRQIARWGSGTGAWRKWGAGDHTMSKDTDSTMRPRGFNS